MVINGQSLLTAAPIKNMLTTKVKEHGVSHGLAEVGYDIRLKQDVRFWGGHIFIGDFNEDQLTSEGKFCIASAIEQFDMPQDLVGIVHDKSTWARQGLSVFNTVIEPGWKGFLTLELVYHGNDDLYIPAGAGIAQVIFHHISDSGQYEGKYQNQADEPVKARIHKADGSGEFHQY